jgi:hypothetical protein
MQRMRARVRGLHAATQCVHVCKVGVRRAARPCVQRSPLRTHVYTPRLLPAPPQGDQRTHSHVVGLRAVCSSDGMTADWYPFTPEFLRTVSARICNQVRCCFRSLASAPLTAGVAAGVEGSGPCTTHARLQTDPPACLNCGDVCRTPSAAPCARHRHQQVRSVNRVVYDITSKPPSTIEWE